MTTTATKAADLLWQAWQSGRTIDHLPAELRPANRRDGYAIQACYEDRSAEPLAGWKIAATSVAGQTHINVDGPIAGRILAERLLGDGATATLAGNFMKVAEPEFAFRFGRDVAPRATPYTTAEVMAAVETLHLAIELPSSRFTDYTKVGAAALIADDACAHDLVVGPAVTADWRAVDLSRHPVIGRLASGLERAGSGANVLGDPRIALTWLVNELSGIGVTLAKGQVVTTGTSVVPVEVRSGDHFTADFGAFGAISVRLA
jgi:2-keto-4-pentenoate hydratase